DLGLSGERAELRPLGGDRPGTERARGEGLAGTERGLAGGEGDVHRSEAAGEVADRTEEPGKRAELITEVEAHSLQDREQFGHVDRKPDAGLGVQNQRTGLPVEGAGRVAFDPHEDLDRDRVGDPDFGQLEVALGYDDLAGFV